MMIDTHVHFWRYTPQEFGWLEGGLTVIRKDFLPTDFSHGYSLVAVQARQSVEETDWLLALAKEHDAIRGVVGWLPLVSPDVESMLDNRNVVGLRHVLQAEPETFFTDAAFNRGLEVLAKRGLTYDLLVSEPQLDATIDLVDRHSDLRYVVDHLAKPDLTAGPTDAWRRGMMDLGRRENVCCKISGGITEANLRWRPEDMQPYFDVVLEAFSPRRLMFGSNWPVSEAAGGYGQWLGAVQTWAGKLTDVENEQLMSKTAVRVYRLEKA
jgi:L-fuconolactonase